MNDLPVAIAGAGGEALGEIGGAVERGCVVGLVEEAVIPAAPGDDVDIAFDETGDAFFDGLEVNSFPGWAVAILGPQTASGATGGRVAGEFIEVHWSARSSAGTAFGRAGSAIVESRKEAGDGTAEFAVENLVSDLSLAFEEGVKEGADDDGQEEGVPELDAPADGLGEDHLGGAFDNVSLAATGFNEVFSELLAEFVNVDVEHVGHGVVVFIEEVLVEEIAGDDFVVMPDHEFGHGVFAGGDFDGLSLDGDGPGGGIDGDVSDGEFGAAFATVAADEGADAGDEFGEVEGFGEVVVSAVVEPLDLVADGIERGEHEDGGLLSSAEFLEDLPPVHDGHEDVENDEVVVPVEGLVETFLAIG